MKERPSDPIRPCANVPCRRPAGPGESLCEACAIERSLFRRDERRPPKGGGEKVLFPAR